MAPADLNDGYAASGEVTAEEPASPASFLMPALEGERMVSPRPMAWTLSAAPDDTIVYSFLTPEGTQVTNRSKGIAFLPTMMPGTRLIWYAENQSSPGEAHARRFEVNEQLQEDAGFLAEQVRPKGRESWTEAKGGQVISLGMNLQHWAPANCPRCIMQVVTLIDGVPSACIINDIPGTWPGVSYDFTVNARMPTAPGSHRVQAKFTLQYTCAAALREAANDPENATTLAVVNVR
jgi:hypothetical protein